MSTTESNTQESSRKSRVAIVTGGSRGIGAEVSRRLASDGFVVIVNYASDEREAQELVARIEVEKGRAVAVQADVRVPTEVRRLFETAERAFGGVDVLVNNAGVMSLATVAEMDDATFDGGWVNGQTLRANGGIV